jgi:hypothetical protein
MGLDAEQNELTNNFKISKVLVYLYSLLGLITISMSAALCYYLYHIFK